MEYTWASYKNLIYILKENGYKFSNYIDYKKYEKVCIMRHDIDFDIEKAIEMSIYDKELEIPSIYFVLIDYELYDALNVSSISYLKKIVENGCEIGLHFDASKANNDDELKYRVLKHKQLLENKVLIGTKQKSIRFLSYHIPNDTLLNSTDKTISGLINAYSKEFFSEFKYISDSGHKWREDPVAIINSGCYNRIQCLTHPIWYCEDNKDLKYYFDIIVNNQMERREYIIKNFKCFLNIEDK